METVEVCVGVVPGRKEEAVFSPPIEEPEIGKEKASSPGIAGPFLPEAAKLCLPNRQVQLPIQGRIGKEKTTITTTTNRKELGRGTQKNRKERC